MEANDRPTITSQSDSIDRLSDFRQSVSSDSTSVEESPSSMPGMASSPHPASDVSREYLPGGKRSLSSIATHAFLLGITLGSCALISALALYFSSQYWRAPFFLALLSAFHFLEFFTTAAYNPPMATVSAYLLRNGRQYTIAHTVALLEALLTTALVPSYQAFFASAPLIGVGAVMIAVGQGVRSLAMMQAGTNFNHHVQTKRSEGHVLVTQGIYSRFRHPAYFGYFWWALGTQLVLGNSICFVAFAYVLLGFFRRRIASEEKALVSFFGDDYVQYRSKTPVGIPFIS